MLSAKLEGQAAVADTLDADAARTIRDHLLRLQAANSIESLRQIESQAALSYWSGWRGIHVRFASRDAPGIPVHWTAFAQRVSLLTGNPRVAVDPINAMLNYLYAVLEAEARLALAAVGLDAGLGVIHADQPARDSLALDLMEAARPAVDAHVLRLVVEHTFTLRDFHETHTGQCRLMPSLTRELAATAPTWAGHVAPHAEMIARKLAEDAGIPGPPTLLTGRARRRARPASNQTRPPKPTKPIIRTTACSECGTTIPRSQKRCAECHAAFNTERIVEKGAEEVVRRQRTGKHPSQEATVRERIGERQRAQWQARRASAPASGYTGQPAEFRHLIIPGLADLSASRIARETGHVPRIGGDSEPVS